MEDKSMARVYISFLGTNDYLECYYCRGKNCLTPKPVRFVQEATIRDNCTDWGPDDRIIIFTTKDAEARNWRNDGHTDKDGNILQRKGLLACLKELSLPVSITNRIIPEGYDENQVWEIFQEVFNLLESEDEVVFDITHAFRSIPLLAIVVLQYARIMKKVTLRGIYYGAFEALGNPVEVRQKPVQDRKAPIIDLTALTGLMDWSIATDRFLESGDVKSAGTLARRGVQGILKETRGGDKAAMAIKNLGVSLEHFSKMLSTCRGPDVSNAARDLLEKADRCKDVNLPRPFRPLFDKIRERLEKNFTGDSLQDGLAAARWCADHNLIQQGFTILAEIVISFIVSTVGQNPLHRGIRELASEAFTTIIGEGSATGSHPKEEPAKDLSAKQHMIELIKSRPGLHRAVEKIRPKRNDLNHAGFREERILLSNADSFTESLHSLIAEVEGALQAATSHV